MSFSPEPARRRDPLATRAKLVRAALELFTSAGYRVTTTPELAQRAGVAEATIYRHFPGKEALLNQAYREAHQWGIGLLKAQEGDRGVPTRERLQRIGRRMVETAAQDPALVRMLLQRTEPGLLDQQSQTEVRQFREGLSAMIAAGKQEGRIRPGSAELWALVWLALVSFVVERVATGEWPLEHPGVGPTLDAAWDAIAYRGALPESPVSRAT